MKQFNPKWYEANRAMRSLPKIEFNQFKKNRNSYTWKARHGFATPFVLCSQCRKGMRGDIAKIQIENKRENAPICFACCSGVKRK